MVERRLAAGEVLFEIDEIGQTVYIVDQGQLAVTIPTPDGEEIPVGQIGPGEVVGEVTAVIGGRRSATVRASAETVVRELDASDFLTWMQQHPDRASDVAIDARRRFDQVRLTRAVADLVGPGQPQLVADLADSVEWVTIDAGDALFNQGDPADAAWILVGGQMRVIATDEDGETTLDTRIGRGDLLGEMGVIEQAPRMATARAIRDCTLAKLPKTTFEELTAAHPALMLPLVRKVLARTSDRGRKAAHAGTVAFFVTAPDAPADLVERITAEVQSFGTSIQLDTARIERLLDQPDIAIAARGSAADSRLIEFLHEVDVTHRWVLLECDPTLSEWTHRALRTADRVVVVASSTPDAAEQRLLQGVRSYLAEMVDFDLWAALVHPRNSTPGASVRLRESLGASRVVNLRSGDDGAVRRVARLVSGNGLGVAFSGGGARSFGQIGALQAMGELGLEIDAVAGTSMGSVISAIIALTDNAEEAIDTAVQAFSAVNYLDYTLPFSSLFAARRMTDAMRGVFGGMDIEDLAIPYSCLSTNLTQATQVEHCRGDLVAAMRASVALPGVFPPVPFEGDLLVDGGVLENLPSGPLLRDPGISRIIGLDVAPPAGPRARSEFGLSLSGRDILTRRIKRQRFRHPPLVTTVIASMLVGSSQARQASLDRGDIDLHVSLNLSGIKLLDAGALEPAIARGYEDSLPVLTDWAG